MLRLKHSTQGEGLTLSDASAANLLAVQSSQDDNYIKILELHR